MRGRGLGGGSRTLGYIAIYGLAGVSGLIHVLPTIHCSPRNLFCTLRIMICLLGEVYRSCPYD